MDALLERPRVRTSTTTTHWQLKQFQEFGGKCTTHFISRNKNFVYVESVVGEAVMRAAALWTVRCALLVNSIPNAGQIMFQNQIKGRRCASALLDNHFLTNFATISPRVLPERATAHQSPLAIAMRRLCVRVVRIIALTRWAAVHSCLEVRIYMQA